MSNNSKKGEPIYRCPSCQSIKVKKYHLRCPSCFQKLPADLEPAYYATQKDPFKKSSEIGFFKVIIGLVLVFGGIYFFEETEVGNVWYRKSNIDKLITSLKSNSQTSSNPISWENQYQRQKQKEKRMKNYCIYLWNNYYVRDRIYDGGFNFPRPALSIDNGYVHLVTTYHSGDCKITKQRKLNKRYWDEGDTFEYKIEDGSLVLWQKIKNGKPKKNY